jgi:ribosomal protein L13E
MMQLPRHQHIVDNQPLKNECAGMTDHSPTDSVLSVPSAETARRARTHSALFHLAGRHAQTKAARARAANANMAGPHEVVRLVAYLAAGSGDYLAGEPPVDADDLMAALTLVPTVRDEVNELEIGLVEMARGRGMTWAEVAFALGLGSAQAAHQRHDRLSQRRDEAGE